MEGTIKPDGRFRRILCWCLVCLYAVAGVFHLLLPEPFLRIIPGWVPAPRDVIFLTGICELAGAAALLIRPLRRPAGVAFALYAVCVYPANINHALQDLWDAGGGSALAWAYHVPRLLLQPVLAWAPLYASGVVSWPFAARRPEKAKSPSGRGA